MSDNINNTGGDKIIPVSIEDEMKSAYIDYSMSVIISRALPDVRDGLKPVHRRVLYGMTDITSGKSYKKSARVVGDVLGKYHPHGESSIYDTLVRMAQPWSMRYQLVDGQGNFGSVDGDAPAAMRYTEVRLYKIAEDMLIDIDKETVDFGLNFDDSLQEPLVLPTKIPNLLINGASGIAVGMATNMAPHNLSEVIDGIISYVNNPEITIEELMAHIKAPDFPTGGHIYGYNGIIEAYRTGRGRLTIRAKACIEEHNGREKIVVTEIPFQVNKASLIERTAELVNEKKIEGISDLRDESDRQGLRIVYEIKRDANASVVLNNLYKYTSLQTYFSINNIALVKGVPMLLNLKALVSNFVDHRHEVITRRAQFELREAEKRIHILEGLLIAIDNINEVIQIIRASQTPAQASDQLIQRFDLSEIQAKAILDMSLRRLTGLEHDKVKQEHEELELKATSLRALLADHGLRMQLIIDELTEIKDKYGDVRKTEIMQEESEITLEDIIPDEEVIVTISNSGYIKRTLLSQYKRQIRGGRGMKGSSIRNEDFIDHVFVATNHNYILFFTEKGKCFKLKVYQIPEGGRDAKGRALPNLIRYDSDDKIKTVLIVKNFNDAQNNYIIMSTKEGVVKRMTLSVFANVNARGVIAINIRDKDELLEARLTTGQSQVLLASKFGNAVRFNEEQVRSMGRTATGVRGMKLNKDDEVIGMAIVDDPSKTSILVVSQKGYGKRTSINEYRVSARGTKGVKTINITPKTGLLVAVKDVVDTDDLMIINKSGITIRIAVSNLRLMGRATQGVRLIKLDNSDEIASIEKINNPTEIDLD
ncbi:MAG: DNA gyrase subunit A [Solitalea-like symbiont of Tyrophagus putrescentiae]